MLACVMTTFLVSTIVLCLTTVLVNQVPCGVADTRDSKGVDSLDYESTDSLSATARTTTFYFQAAKTVDNSSLQS